MIAKLSKKYWMNYLLIAYTEYKAHYISVPILYIQIHNVNIEIEEPYYYCNQWKQQEFYFKLLVFQQENMKQLEIIPVFVAQAQGQNCKQNQFEVLHLHLGYGQLEKVILQGDLDVHEQLHQNLENIQPWNSNDSLNSQILYPKQEFEVFTEQASISGHCYLKVQILDLQQYIQLVSVWIHTNIRYLLMYYCYHIQCFRYDQGWNTSSCSFLSRKFLYFIFFIYVFMYLLNLQQIANNYQHVQLKMICIQMLIYAYKLINYLDNKQSYYPHKLPTQMSQTYTTNTIITIILAVIVSTALFYNIQNKSTSTSSATKQIQKLYQEWINKYSKQYTLLGEALYRKEIWMRNYRYVIQHNDKYSKGQESYDLQMNQFADLSQKQFGQIYLMKNYHNQNHKSTTSKCNGSQPPESSLPQAIDWAAKGGVTYIKDQGQCGSCWAFSATGALQGIRYKKQGTLSSFSEQQLMDCSSSYENNGCNGGFMQNSFYYVIDHGITTQSKYPYKALTSNCNYQQQTDKVFQIRDCTAVTTHKQKSLMASIAQQPTSVAIQANHLSFQLYKSGIYNGNCGTKLDHGVLAVGYGTLDNKPYYKVKNSWGSRWGMQGYIYIIRNGDGKGKCGILLQPSIPIA